MAARCECVGAASVERAGGLGERAPHMRHLGDRSPLDHLGVVLRKTGPKTRAVYGRIAWAAYGLAATSRRAVSSDGLEPRITFNLVESR